MEQLCYSVVSNAFETLHFMLAKTEAEIVTISGLQRFHPPDTRHAGAKGERKYSSYSFLTSALHGGEWSASRSGHALA
jgi:hypothetical protein